MTRVSRQKHTHTFEREREREFECEFKLKRGREPMTAPDNANKRLLSRAFSLSLLMFHNLQFLFRHTLLLLYTTILCVYTLAVY